MAGHVRQRRPADLLAADRRPGGDRRLHAVLHLPGPARSARRGGVVDGGSRTRRGRVRREQSEHDGTSARIRNPILPGFNPDPSIVRVGDDYYIATSTFEWYPGVQIHHSRDLVHWRLLTRPLNRASQLNMLRRSRFLRHLGALPDLCRRPVLADLHRRETLRPHHAGGAPGASLRDTHNYLVTSPRIDGEWSDPVYLNSSGFDPSLFHDDDGRKYLVNMLWDHRPGHNRFAGIVLQEYSPAERKLVGPVHLIFHGTPIGFTEGAAPLQAQRLLLPADRRRRHRVGTRGHHGAVAGTDGTLRTASGHVHPDLAPSAGCRTAARRARRPRGDADGETYMVHLCGRPIPNRGRCTLGRETAIQQMAWSEDGWLRTADGTGVPQVRSSRAGPALAHVPRIARARGLRQPDSAAGFPVAAVPLAGRTLQPYGTARISCGCTAAKRSAACSDSRWSRGASRRIVSAPRRQWNSSRRRSSRWPAWSAITTAASFTTSTFRTMRTWADTSALCHACPTRFSPTSSARLSQFPPAGRFICAWKSTTNACTSLSESEAVNGAGCRGRSTRASCPTRPRLRALPISRAPSSAYVARTWPGHALPADFDYFAYRERSYRADPFTEVGSFRRFASD